MTGAAPRIAVVVFPGSNDDRDAALALEGLGAEPVLHWHGEPELPEVGAVVLPGGFSYGDYLRTGAIASVAPVMMPPKLAGMVRPTVVRQRLTPSAKLASRNVSGTSASTSCVDRAMSGSMMIASAIPPAHALCW